MSSGCDSALAIGVSAPSMGEINTTAIKDLSDLRRIVDLLRLVLGFRFDQDIFWQGSR
jgi:hypothetical protein